MDSLIRGMASPAVVIFAILVGAESLSGADSQQQLVTRWAAEASSENVWPEYPRPQMVRDEWLNLNGRWQLAITGMTKTPPESFAEKVVVPFPLESHLGGVSRTLSPSHRAWYSRSFEIDPGWEGHRILLHFGAVDWHAEVWINGTRVGEHFGGYDPFHFDITKHLKRNEENSIVVGVSDPTDSGSQPRGKQKRSPGGIWYTPVSGVWQTVWLEPVPEAYIQNLKITPNLGESTVAIEVAVEGGIPDQTVQIEAATGDKIVSSARGVPGESIVLNIDNPQSWSPNNPFLYDLKVELLSDGQASDRVLSYFGMRSITLGRDRNGQTRMLLNGEPVFQYGPLDQGYWPDGLYTAPCDEALRYDLEVAKRLGFNMVRKHVKVEPARWYYWCDRLGLLVWQDMPNGDQHAPWPADGQEIQRTEESAAQYVTELKAMVDALWNSPCVIVWVPFNEAWGQFQTELITQSIQEYDPTRLVISASGGNDFGCGHINDDHFYPGPGAPPAERDRAAVLGEFGGFGLPLQGHTWEGKGNWGYRSFRTKEEFATAYKELIAKLRPLVESHLSAAVYTQATDVEIEVNGLMTYDREIIKVDEELVRAAHATLFAPLPPQDEIAWTAASTLAWWRFEEGNANSHVTDLSKRMGAIAARDFSGRNNHLYAFSPQNAPAISSSVPKRLFGVLQDENRLCLDDTSQPGQGALTRDLFTNPRVARTHMDAVNCFPFSAWTIEASFSLANSNGDRVVLGKEYDSGGTLSPLFQLGVFGSPPTIGVELIDEQGNEVVIHSDRRVNENQWWHVAVTCDERTVKLFVASDNRTQAVELVGEAPINGSLDQREGTWVIGRGCESGKMGRDFLGWIDEIRISTKALELSQFLFGHPKQVTDTLGRK